MIVVCGEALIDLVPLGVEGTYAPRPGGSPANVAVGLGRLGVPVALLSRVSGDAFGRALTAHVRAAHVDTAWVIPAAEPSTLAVVTLDDDGNAEYAFYVDGAADGGWRREDLPAALPAGAALHVSGSLALGVPAMGDTLEALLRRERGRRVLTLDPNVRPRLARDETDLRARLDRWLGLVDLVKVSADDLGWIAPGQAVEAVAAGWLARGPALVVVTRGRDGVHAHGPGDPVDLPALAVDVIDTVGAGDAFMAGLLCALDEGGDLAPQRLASLAPDALRGALAFAQQVAAETCRRVGADPPWRAELDLDCRPAEPAPVPRRNTVAVHDRAGTPAQPQDLVDVARLVTAYYSEHPDPADPGQRVAFGTSGHRGSSLHIAFNDDHIAATSQAISDHRRGAGIDGPLFLAKDTHALSEPAWATALEVFAANGVTVLVDSRDRYTPTPALSHAVLTYNRGRTSGLADGVVVTPSHNPPADGGFKYNPPDGGPAGSDITGAVQDAANGYLRAGLTGVRRLPLARARSADTTGSYDFLASYVDDLPSALDLDAVREAGVRIGADPLGGASVDYWGAIAERHRLDLTVVNPLVDPTWRFMTLDWDGKVRMDCSSPYAMASLIANKDAYQIATGNDADADRHGIVTPDAGLLAPNAYLAVAIEHLLATRTGWPATAAIGKTLVSSSLIDRVVAGLGRQLLEVPVGFKWFVPGLLDGSVAFGGEESAGASFLRRDGTVWTTDKDGILLCLLAAEILAVTGSSPSERYAALTARYGEPSYARVDAPASREQKAALANLSPDQVTATELAGEPITAKLTRAPGNDAPIGGLKVTTENGWFAARPSGTEDVYKIYAESFLGADHLARIQEEARALVNDVL